MFPSLCQWRLSLPVATVRCGQEPTCLRSPRETAIVNWSQSRKHMINIIGKIRCYILLSDIKLVNVTGMPGILATVTFQMLWPLATMNSGSLRPRISSLQPIKCYSIWPQQYIIFKCLFQKIKKKNVFEKILQLLHLWLQQTVL